MGGTLAGGKRAAATNKAKHGEDFYKNLGRMGGSVSHPETRAFALDRALASRAGKISKRGRAKKNISKEGRHGKR